MARPEELKADLVLEICRRLRCRLDRASMAATCQPWKEAITRDGAPLLRQLPVLYFPSALGPSFSCLSCGGELHDLALLLPEGITEARLIGSRKGWWWIAATGYTEGHVLTNTGSGQQIRLPDAMRIGLGDNIDAVQILAATFSSTPNGQVPPALCYGAALVKRTVLHDIMFWRCHEDIGLSSRNVAFHMARRADDVICDDGIFKFLAPTERLLFVVPDIKDGDTELRADVWAPGVDVPDFEPLEEGIEICARYLVISRGELLLVRRYCMNDMVTTSFRLYQLQQLHMGKSPEEDHFRWVQLHELGGRMLFVARGCSMAFEVEDFDGYPAALEGVYFKGDVDELNDAWLQLPDLDRRLMMEDCGRWSGPGPFPGNHHACFQTPDQVEGTRDHSAPAWLIPMDE